MKWKIAILTFALPVICILFLSYTLTTNQPPFNTFVASILVLLAIARIFLFDRRYLYACLPENDTLKVEYLTPLFRKKSMHIKLSVLKDIKLSKGGWLLSTLDIKTQEEWIRFEILQKEILATIEGQLALVRTGGMPFS